MFAVFKLHGVDKIGGHRDIHDAVAVDDRDGLILGSNDVFETKRNVVVVVAVEANRVARLKVQLVAVNPVALDGDDVLALLACLLSNWLSIQQADEKK